MKGMLFVVENKVKSFDLLTRFRHRHQDGQIKEFHKQPDEFSTLRGEDITVRGMSPKPKEF